nr:probable leucine-rich repeat receptor-like protein kinase At5g49770 [Tanacetum cinerariifolium]
GSHFNVQGANVFNSFIVNAGLEEVPIEGSAFTWCHKSATKMSKLDRNAPEDRSNGMRNMTGKLKFLKYKIRKWIKDNRCNRKVAFDKLKEELRLVDEAIDKGVGTEEVVNKRVEVLNSLRYIDQMHAMDLAQKAKIKWSIEGEQRDELEREVTIEEIKTAVWNCGTYKSPGPDGFTFDFYRQFWSTNDKDVYAARVIDVGLFNGINLNHSLCLSHMFYADDAIFMGQWSDGNITTSIHVLECFFHASGLNINLCKSSIPIFHMSIFRVPSKVLPILESIRGRFSMDMRLAVKRRIIDEMRFPNIGDTTRWVKYVLIKVNILAWKIRCDVFPTRMNMSRRGIDIQAVSCPICDYGVESSEHLFFRCNMIRNIGKQIVRLWNINYEEVSTYDEWKTWLTSCRMASKLKQVFEGVWYTLWWFAWTYRNKLLFDNKTPTKSIIFDNVISSSFYLSVTDPSDFGVLTAIRSSWQNLPPNWTGSDPCGSNWEGINCTNSRVTTLNLAGMGVKTNEIGDIPSLTMLQYLDLSNNRGIKANLPQSIQKLQNLTTLILVGCSFRGQIPDSIGSLKKLGFLGLNNNSFTGPIPPTIGNLTNLTWLDLSDNQLSGLIPITNAATLGLDRLVNARHFHLANNRLSGPVLSQLFNANMSLIHVILNNNQLNGTIPASIGTVGTLKVIRLDSNSLRGRVPQNITNAKNVNELYLSNNNLNGSVPNLVVMDSLFYVDMSNNSFDTSDIPSWFKLESLNTLLMDKTQLQGEIPSDMFHPQLERLVLSNNDLNGTLDIGNRYSSDLIVDLSYNSIANFTQESGYNMSLNLVNNPVCEGTRARGRYCADPNIRNSLPENSCTPVRCAFQSNQLPVDSISITNATIDEFSYLQYRLHIFPSGQDYFTRSAISSIGTVINRQQFTLPHFGPLFFLDESYCCFPGNKSSNRGIIIGVAVGSLVLLLLIASIITYAIFQKRKAKRAKESSPFASWGLDNGSDVGGVPQLKGARACSFEELKRCSNYFSEENIIGSGGYGQVYKGTLNTGQVVAIKRAQQGSLQGSYEFKTEIELLSRIHHKNVVALVGFCYEQGEQMLVYEFISNGTLKDNLTGKAGMKLDWMKRLKVALDSANGLTYLHELANPPIIHRDVKSNNILLDDHLNAKVADFGLSKLLGDESKGYVSTQVKGTLGYMDPEYYMTQQLTEKSDVYSFGIVLLEMLTSRSPIQKGKFIVREVKEAIDKSGDPNGLSNIIDPSLGSYKTLGGLTKFVNLAMRCVQDSGADRPKMGEVVREIESIIDLAVLSLDVESASTFSSQNTGNIGDLYYPYGDSVSDASSLSVPFETELRR